MLAVFSLRRTREERKVVIETAVVVVNVLVGANPRSNISKEVVMSATATNSNGTEAIDLLVEGLRLPRKGVPKERQVIEGWSCKMGKFKCVCVHCCVIK